MIALITVPIVTSTMKDARKSSFKTSMLNLVKAADNYYADNQLDITSPIAFDFIRGGASETGEELSFKGTKPKTGRLIINVDGEITLQDVSDGSYYANYNSSSDDDVIVTEDNEILTRDELTERLKKLEQELSSTKTELSKKANQTDLEKTNTQLSSTTTIANTANTTVNQLNNTLTPKVTTISAQVDKNLTSINAINSNWGQRFNSISNENYLPYSCGSDNATMKRMIQDYWNGFLVGFSAKLMNGYGCAFMVYINKSTNNYGTVILTGYPWNGMAIGVVDGGKWTWTNH